ncbi:MAG: hypothetical protein ABJH04_18575 [Cyclobacteriaceae bacterium]
MRIILSIPEGQNVRNLLENGILSELNIVFDHPEVIIITPAYRIKSFTEKWQGVKWYRLLPIRLTRRQSLLSRVRKRAVRLRQNWIANILLNAERSVLLNEALEYEQLLLEKKDETIVICSHIHLPFEAQLSNYAKKHQIPVVGIVNSWDNVHKGIHTHTDRVFVWGDQNKSEMITMEGYIDKNVIPTGSPSFDPYFIKEHQWSRKDFCDRIKLDPSRPILLYASIGQFVPFIEETFILDELAKLIEDFPVENRPQIICRLHPWSKKEIFKAYLDHPDIVFSGFENYVPTLNWAPTFDEMIFSANLLKHSSICISPGSTMVLEAAIFDTPTIVPIYNNYQPEVWEDYYSRFCLAMHFSRLIEGKLVPVIRNSIQLKECINKYLSDPSFFSVERRNIVNQYIKYGDGNSLKRIVKETKVLFDESVGSEPQS